MEFCPTKVFKLTFIFNQNLLRGYTQIFINNFDVLSYQRLDVIKSFFRPKLLPRISHIGYTIDL